MNKKITISSTQTIVVAPNLKIKDLTDPYSMAPNKLNAIVDYGVDEPVKILVGVHEYDAKIKDWNTVKALVESKVLTIADAPESARAVVKKEIKVENSKLKL